VNVRQSPIARQRIALERQAEAVPHHAVRPIAPDQPFRRQRLFLAARFAQHACHAAFAGSERGDFDLALDGDGLAVQMFLKKPLGL
jgi:hypothetical protein